MNSPIDTTPVACIFESHQFDTLVDNDGRRLCVRCGHPEPFMPEDGEQADDEVPFIEGLQ